MYFITDETTHVKIIGPNTIYYMDKAVLNYRINTIDQHIVIYQNEQVLVVIPFLELSVPIFSNIPTLEIDLEFIFESINLNLTNVETLLTHIDNDLHDIKTYTDEIETILTNIDNNTDDLETILTHIDSDLHDVLLNTDGIETLLTNIDISTDSVETLLTHIDSDLHSINVAISNTNSDLNYHEQSYLGMKGTNKYISLNGKLSNILSTFKLIGEGLPTVYNWLSVAQQIKISSNSVLDTLLGDGCRTLWISGLDSGFNIISEIVNMDGITPVLTSLSYIRVNFIHVETAGIWNSNFGNIHCGVGTVVLGVNDDNLQYITRLESQNKSIVYSLPIGYTALFKYFMFNINTETVNRRPAVIKFIVRKNTNPAVIYNVIEQEGVDSFVLEGEIPFTSFHFEGLNSSFDIYAETKNLNNADNTINVYMNVQFLLKQLI